MNAQLPTKKKVPATDSVLQERLGASIRLLRKKLGITQEELAWRADMHRTYLADIERGSRNITLRSVGQLAKALKVSVADLLSPVGSTGGFAWPGGTEPYGEILLVEDTATDATLVVRAFKRAKIANPVTVVETGEEALDYLNRSGRYAGHTSPLPQLVLLDLNLPGMSGIEVLRAIKQAPATKRLPVIVLTLSQHDHNVIECGRLGAVNYIVKPVEFESFSRIASVLDLRSRLALGRASAR